MSAIDLTSELQSLGLGAPPPAGSAEESAEETFLTLMLAQLQNQDPFQPMESGEFLSQLAAFETAAGVQSLDGSFLALSEALYSSQALQAASLIDHDVLADLDAGQLPDGGTLDGAVIVPTTSSSVMVEITDASGELIRRLDLGQQAAGQIAFSWDGTNAQGEPMPAGAYQVSAEVVVDGETQAASTVVSAHVESVNLGSATGDVLLNLSGLGQISLSEVLEIS